MGAWLEAAFGVALAVAGVVGFFTAVLLLLSLYGLTQEQRRSKPIEHRGVAGCPPRDPPEGDTP